MASGRKGIPNIPKEDLHWMVELAKTLTMQEIAAKWDVGAGPMGRFLKRHGYTAGKIKIKHRIDFILSNPTMTIKEIAAGIGCQKSVILE